MMQRIAVILSALLVVVATTGVPTITHHCLVKGKDTWISVMTDYSCCGDEDGMMRGCCSNEFELNKVDDSFLSFNLITDFFPEFVVAFAKSFVIHDFALVNTASILPTNDSNPPPARDNIRVFVQVFLL